MNSNPKGMPIREGDILTLHSNPARFLYKFAEELIKKAEEITGQGKTNSLEEIIFANGAIALILSFAEALANRIYDEFLMTKFPQRIYQEMMDKWSPVMKWYLAPILIGKRETFDVSKEPWQSFCELITIRNYFAHPKPINQQLEIKNPHGKIKVVDFKDKDVPRWPQTKIPKDFNHIRVSDVKKASETLNKMIDELDRLMDGVIKKDDWYLTEKVTKANEFAVNEDTSGEK